MCPNDNRGRPTMPGVGAPERSSGNHLCGTKRHYHIRVHARRWNFLDRNARCNVRKHCARDGLERAKRGRCHLPCRRSDGFNCVSRSCEEIPLNQSARNEWVICIYIRDSINCYNFLILSFFICRCMFLLRKFLFTNFFITYKDHPEIYVDIVGKIF